MFVLFTDFGASGPYLGQMRAVLHRDAPGVPVLDLMADVPAFDVRAGAYLLAAYAPAFPKGAHFVCVVDPGVGGARRGLVLEGNGQCFIGPDNGLLAIVSRRLQGACFHEIAWRPERLSASFHGRDLFAPLAARLAQGLRDGLESCDTESIVGRDWPDDLAQVVYIDTYGNAVTGLRAAGLQGDARLEVADTIVRRARTFSDVPVGGAFWYENANGLAEIAVNQGRAAALGLTVGTEIRVLKDA